MKHSRGFTLIELMIVVAIIAILASIAISAYSRSVGKAQLSEAFTVADGLKADVIDYQRQTGACPTAANGGISLPTSYAGKYVESASVTSGADGCVITTLMRNNTVDLKLRGSKVVFSMASSGGTTTWVCSSDAPAVYLPQTCR